MGWDGADEAGNRPNRGVSRGNMGCDGQWCRQTMAPLQKLVEMFTAYNLILENRSCYLYREALPPCMNPKKFVLTMRPKLRR